MTAQYTGTGTYSDGSTQTITDQVIWSSEDTNIATFSATSGQEGFLSTHAEAGISGSTILTVLASDTTAPTVIGAASLSPTTVRITFSESVNEGDDGLKL